MNKLLAALLSLAFAGTVLVQNTAPVLALVDAPKAETKSAPAKTSAKKGTPKKKSTSFKSKAKPAPKADEKKS